MYLVAQRVQLKNGVEEADHLCLYQHADNRLQLREDLKGYAFAGELIHKHTVLPCGGNPVLSYVDVLCPEGTLPNQIRSSYMQAVAEQRLVHTLTMPDVYTDIVPGPNELPRIPCYVAGGDDMVWFDIAVWGVAPGVFWFVEAPRLLNQLLDWVEQL